jgi:NADH oxidoreductase Hcr
MNSIFQTAPGELAPLVCIERIDETSDAATFVFTTADATPLDYKAGQFIVVAVDVADQLLHRAYSLSSTPSRPENVAITVKRVSAGKVSNHLLDHLRPGHRLSAMAPAGDFNIIDRRSTERIVLLSAGCGITPCLAIARWLLDSAPSVGIEFIHSARCGADVIMSATLDRLHAEHPNFHLTRVLEQTDRAGDCSGPLDRALFDRLLPDLGQRTIFTCGPQAYMDAVRSFAAAREFDMSYFHCESFSAPAVASTGGPGEISGVAERYTLSAPAFGKSSEILGHQNLLEALEGAGIPIIGACRSGVCGSCKCQVISGEIDSTSHATLSAEQISSGFVLACSSKARSDLVVAL